MGICRQEGYAIVVYTLKNNDKESVNEVPGNQSLQSNIYCGASLSLDPENAVLVKMKSFENSRSISRSKFWR